MKDPHIIEFPQIGRPDIGFIGVGEQNDLIPFDIQRVFWTYFTPESIIRGRHAHLDTEMILIALSGRIVVNTEMVPGELESFILDKPNVGVYMPPMCWHTMQYSHTAAQMVIASTKYDEQDYVRSYDDFVKRYSENK